MHVCIKINLQAIKSVNSSNATYHNTVFSFTASCGVWCEFTCLCLCVCASSSNGWYQVEGSGGDGFLPCVWVSAECCTGQRLRGSTTQLVFTYSQMACTCNSLHVNLLTSLSLQLTWSRFLPLCSTMFAVFFFLNFILWIKGSSAAIPFGTLVALLALW